LIGNDIIDLSLAERESNWQRKGFLEKQFSKKEQTIILESEKPFEMVWLFWSMKESAYKVWVQQHEKRMFAPLQFECKLSSETEGQVLFQEQEFHTTSRIDGYYIFTLANLDKKVKTVSWIGPPNGIENSLKKRLEEETGVLCTRIEKRKSESGAPNYYCEDQPLTRSCSISHHGNYGAFSLLLD